MFAHSGFALRGWTCLIALFIGLHLIPVNAQQIVKVGGYDFPPFVDKTPGATSLTLDLIAAMNAFQKKYIFQFVDTSSKRRFINFDEKKYDLIFFEAKDWGWQGRDIDASEVIMHGGAVYVTRADRNKDQEYFDDFRGKSIWGILGYHYGFANFNADHEYLTKVFNAHMITSLQGLIEAAATGRADVSVVVNEYLQIYLHRHPDVRRKILISNKFDAVNAYTILVRKGINPDVAEMNRLMADMESAGVLKQLWGRYKLK